MIVRTKRATHVETESSVLAWLRMSRVYQKIDRASEQLFRRYGLNTAQFDVLARVGAVDGRTQQDVADSLLVTKGNVSQLIRKLEARRMIVRRRVGRTNCLSLTPRGRAVFDRAIPEQELQLSDLFSRLTEAERNQLNRLLRKLDRGLDA